MISDTERVFFALLRAGLWEQEIELQPFEPVDFAALYELADEQAIVGLVGAGLELITDTKVQKMQARPFLKRVFAIEQRNLKMNAFVKQLFERLRGVGINAVLVKGQGVAQCYKRPEWRSSGDVDLFVDALDYDRAKTVLIPLATSEDEEDERRLHWGMTIDGFCVELHGTLRAHISKSIDSVIDTAQNRTFTNNEVREWNCKGAMVHLPSCDNDVIFIFTHILQHFYKGGIGLRQICDWCRLLWTYRNSIDRGLLLERLSEMEVLQEWKAFASLAVDTLGMPQDAMPFYDSASCYSRKGRQILGIVLQKGNFGHNEDKSYYQKHSYFVVKTISFFRWIRDYSKLFFIFPKNSCRAFGRIISEGTAVAIKGE